MFKMKRYVALMLVFVLAFTNLSVPSSVVYATEESGGEANTAYSQVVYKTMVAIGDTDTQYKSIAKIHPDGTSGDSLSDSKLVSVSAESVLGSVYFDDSASSIYAPLDNKKYIVYNGALTEITAENASTYIGVSNDAAFAQTYNGLSGWDETNGCPIIYYFYKGQSYNVTFIAGYGGSITGTQTATVNYMSSLSEIPAVQANNGYVFKDWTIDGASYSKEELADYVFSGDYKNCTIQANFQKVTHKIHVDFYDGMSNDYAVDVDTDLSSLYNIMVSDASREGYKFLGFADNEGNIIDASSLTYTTDANYTAKYEQLMQCYNVVYNDGKDVSYSIISNMAMLEIEIDGSNSEILNSFDLSGDSLSSYPMFVSDGHKWVVVSRLGMSTFRAIYYPADESTENGNYIEDRCVYDEENQVYHISGIGADEKPFVYTYETKNDQGESVDATINATKVSLVAFAGDGSEGLLELSKKGYTFDGWYDALTGGNKISSIADFTSENMELYAHWSPIVYSVTLSLDGGEFTEETPLAYSYDVENGFNLDGVQQPSLTLPTPVRDHYNFSGWYYTDDNDEAHKVSSIYSSTAYMNYDLTARWTPVQYRINYDLDGGTIKDAPQYHAYGESDLVIPTPTKNGYVFDAWYVDITLETPLEDIGAYDRQVTLYAKWQPRTFKIIYELNGGVGSTYNPSNYVSGKEPMIYNPTRANYIFSGWFTDKELTKPMTEADFASGKDVTLYAKWLGDKYSLSYDFNGASVITEPSYFRYGTAPKLANPSKKGYVFTGWYFDEACTNKVTENSPEWSTAANLKLYAGFKARWYKISYKLNGGTIKKAPQSFAFEIPADVPNPKKTGYMFMGWFTDKKCKTKLTNASYNNAADMTLYAKWKKCKPGKSKVSKLKSKSKGKLEVKIKKQNKIDGYQIRYATNKDFKKAKKKYTDSTTINLKKLKSGSVYYVQVRTYIVDSTNKMVYSKWSKIKTVKVK